MNANMKESPTLNAKVDANINPEILSNLRDLEGLGIDKDLFAGFEKRVLQIVSQNPGSEHLVVAELGKTQLSIENLGNNGGKNREKKDLMAYTQERIRGVIWQAANDEQFGLAA
ncbi:MAG: hypothetical protein PHE25_03160 [Candidatus Gracilibacteria bacterium]|nr:hypothetical protein [Candidatus Gracilibacteria bacterium]